MGDQIAMQAKSKLAGETSESASEPAIPRHELISSDADPQETVEWLEAWDQILDDKGPERASYLLSALSSRAHSAGIDLPPAAKISV